MHSCIMVVMKMPKKKKNVTTVVGSVTMALAVTMMLCFAYSPVANAHTTTAVSSGSSSSHHHDPAAEGCHAGSGILGDVEICEECPAGSQSFGGIGARCNGCIKGFYSYSKGSSECTFCPTGSHNRDEGMTYCGWCHEGYGLEDDPAYPGSRFFCKQCDAGSYSDQVGEWRCKPCPPNTYQPNAGSNHCLPCDGTSGTGNKCCGTTCTAEYVKPPELEYVEKFIDPYVYVYQKLKEQQEKANKQAIDAAANQAAADSLEKISETVDEASSSAAPPRNIATAASSVMLRWIAGSVTAIAMVDGVLF